jgi:hypothetical protein
MIRWVPSSSSIQFWLRFLFFSVFPKSFVIVWASSSFDDDPALELRRWTRWWCFGNLRVYPLANSHWFLLVSAKLEWNSMWWWFCDAEFGVNWTNLSSLVMDCVAGKVVRVWRWWTCSSCSWVFWEFVTVLICSEQREKLWSVCDEVLESEWHCNDWGLL